MIVQCEMYYDVFIINQFKHCALNIKDIDSEFIIGVCDIERCSVGEWGKTLLDINIRYCLDRYLHKSMIVIGPTHSTGIGGLLLVKFTN